MRERWDEVVRTYDKNFSLLEAARLQYGKQVQGLITELKIKMESMTPLIAMPEGVTLNIFVDIPASESGKSQLKCSIVAGDTYWTVTARASAPWEGPSGTLEILSSYSNPPEIYIDLPYIEKLISQKGGWKTNRNPSDVRFEQNCVRAENLDLFDPGVVNTCASKMKEFIEMSAWLTRQISDSVEAFRKVGRSLDQCLSKMHKLLPPERHFEPEEVTNWNSLRIIEMKKKPHGPNIWIGVHRSTRSLMYGLDAQTQEQQREIRERIGKRQDEKIGPYWHNTIRKEKEIKAAAEEEITKVCQNAFLEFIKLT